MASLVARITSSMDRALMNPTGARLLQIGAGAVILFRVLTEMRHVQFLYGPHGTAIGSSVGLFGPHVGTFLDAVFYSETGVYFMLLVWATGALGLIAGWGGRWSAVLALLGYLLVESRTNISDGGDNVLRLVLLYMVFFHPKLTRSERIKPGPAVFLHNLAVIAVHLQLMLLYLVSGTMKLQGDVWVNGTAIYYVMHTDWFGPGQGWLRDLFKDPWIVTLATYGAVLFQIGFPFMLFGPGHLPWLAFGIAFHAGIAVTMGLITFAATMIALLLFTVRETQWAAIRSFVSARVPEVTVYIDGYCSYCKTTGRSIELLDLLGVFRVKSFRHDLDYLEHGIKPEDLEHEMHVVVPRAGRTTVFRGFAAVLAVLGHLPLLWVVWPAAWLAGKAGLGARLYCWLAERRVLVPDRRSCRSDACLVQEGGDVLPPVQETRARSSGSPATERQEGRKGQ